MGKQSSQHSIPAVDSFKDPEWSFIMACAWIAHRTQVAVGTAARGYGGITRAAVDRLLRELRAGRLAAWARADGKAFPIAPQHWRALEPVFVRKRFLAGFAECFGRLTVTVRNGTDKDIRDLTISSESLQQIFPANGFANAYQVRQPQRERARMGLEGRFGKKIPAPTEMSDRILYKETTNWLARHDPLPKGYSEVSLNTVLRAARRKK